jgi:hypothetical protein
VTDLLRRGVSWRAVILALLLIPINVYWVTVVEVRWYTLDGSCLPLFITPIFMLFLLALGNLAVGRWAPRLAFSRGELLVVYILVVISCTLSGHDMLQNLMGTIVHPFRYATPENGWERMFFHYIPPWLTVVEPADPTKQHVIKGFYEGNANLYDPSLFLPWIKPLAIWGGFVLLLIWMMLCLNVVIRRQWTVNERLTYPIVQLPLEMTREGGVGFFRSKVMWGGFAVAFLIGLLSGIHELYPIVPAINVKQTDLRQHLTDRPWNAIDRPTISFYPFMIGLAYFLPLDLSFSCWFFFVVRQVQRIVGSLAGWDQGVDFPYISEQGCGSWLALSILALWGSKHYLRGVLGMVFHPRAGGDEEEPLRYVWAVVGFVAGWIVLLWFCAQAGLSLLVANLFFLLFFLLSLAMTRVRAELGTPHEIYFVNPRRILITLAGSEAFSSRDLTIISYFYWFNRCYRCHPMPPQLEAFKMAETAHIPNRRLLWAILGVSLFSIGVTFWANLHVVYLDGAAAKCRGFKSWLGWESFNTLAAWLRLPEEVRPGPVTAMNVAFLFTFICSAMRRRFLWWPFHPAGYALAVSFAMDYFWFAVFVAWLIKSVILKYGGMKMYRQAMPFFLGGILGDYVIGSIWAIIGPVAGVVSYKIFI